MAADTNILTADSKERFPFPREVRFNRYAHSAVPSLVDWSFQDSRTGSDWHAEVLQKTLLVSPGGFWMNATLIRRAWRSTLGLPGSSRRSPGALFSSSWSSFGGLSRNLGFLWETSRLPWLSSGGYWLPWGRKLSKFECKTVPKTGPSWRLCVQTKPSKNRCFSWVLAIFWFWGWRKLRNCSKRLLNELKTYSKCG